MMERFLRLFRLSRDLHEIEALTDAELAALGVTRAEAVALTHLPDEVPARVTAMAQAFGLDPAELLSHRRLWHELLQSCHGCTDLPACHRFMARAMPEAAPGFCPNRATFEALSASLH